MPRPIAFDRRKVLDAATDLIWRRGYEASSVSDLEAAMGLSKSSLYNSFGSKRQLLTGVLEHYSASQAGMLRTLLGRKGLRAGLRALLESIASDNNDGRGCLLVNCAAELAARDRRIAGELRRGLAQIGDVLRTAIAQTQQLGGIPPGTDADVLAQSLIALIAGLRIQAKAGAERRTLQAVAQHSLEALLPAAAAASEPDR